MEFSLASSPFSSPAFSCRLRRSSFAFVSERCFSIRASLDSKSFLWVCFSSSLLSHSCMSLMSDERWTSFSLSEMLCLSRLSMTCISAFAEIMLFWKSCSSMSRPFLSAFLDFTRPCFFSSVIGLSHTGHLATSFPSSSMPLSIRPILVSTEAIWPFCSARRSRLFRISSSAVLICSSIAPSCLVMSARSFPFMSSLLFLREDESSFIAELAPCSSLPSLFDSDSSLSNPERSSSSLFASLLRTSILSFAGFASSLRDPISWLMFSILSASISFSSCATSLAFSFMPKEILLERETEPSLASSYLSTFSISSICCILWPFGTLRK